MEQKANFRLRLNLFDGIVLAAALLVGAFLLWRAVKPQGAVEGIPAAASATVQYTLRFQRWAEGTSALIEPGDQLYDNIKNYAIGQVVSVQAVPAETPVLDQERHRQVQAVLEGFEDVLVTIQAPCAASDEAIVVGGGYELRSGATAYVKGQGYMGSGPIVSVEEVRK